MKKVLIKQTFTEAGGLGVALIIVGPVLTAFSYVSFLPAGRPYTGSPAVDVSWLYWVAGIGAIATLLSIPLLIVGRKYEVETVDRS